MDKKYTYIIKEIDKIHDERRKLNNRENVLYENIL